MIILKAYIGYKQRCRLIYASYSYSRIDCVINNNELTKVCCMQIMNVVMLIVPVLLAVMMHSYLTHGEMGLKKVVLFVLVYFVAINMVVIMISTFRGVKGLNFYGMTMTYKMKYLGTGMLVGFLMPFPLCIIVEERLAMHEIRRCINRFVKDVRGYWQFSFRSAKADLSSEVAGSYLNWMWWLIEPFCTMCIYWFIFGVVFKATEVCFPAFIFIGLTMWSFFYRGISGSVNMVRENKGIITKIYLPKYILLFSKMLVNGFKMMVSFAMVLLLMIVFKVTPSFNIIYFAPIVFVLFLFTFGVGCIMMHYGVYVSDLAYITGIVLNMLMYLTGTFYDLGKRIPQPFGIILEKCNPIAFLIKSMREALLYGQCPDLKILFVWLIISILLISLGVFTIYSNENSYVKMI